MRKYLYVAVFISGMTSLAIEMAASRLIGRSFGTSNLVWASIIGLILIYLAGGYFLGGYWADRSPSYRTFFLISLFVGLFTCLIPVIGKPVLRFAADAFDQLQLGILAGSFVTVIVTLSIPMVLLGTTSPFAIRLATQDHQKIGRVSGLIYAISTLGSFIGTFLPTLLLIPMIGTDKTFLLFGILQTITAVIGLWLSAGKKVASLSTLSIIPLVIFWIWGLPGGAKATQGQIFETESAYNYIQVLQDGEFRYLRLNEGQGIHSIYNPNELNFHGPWEQVLVAPFFNPAPYDVKSVKSMAIVGLAAGTTARQATAVYGDIAIDGYEIDPAIVQAGQQYFDMNEPNLNVIVQDGRVGLESSNKKYQIISIDAYRPPYIPWHLTTQEFFETVHQKLTDDGVMVINVGRAPGDRTLINTLASTIRTVFPSIYVVDLPLTFNSMIFATAQPTQIENFYNNLLYLYQQGNTHPLLLDTMQVSYANLQPDPPAAQVFTDDVAPIELITNNMVVKFLLSGETETISHE